MFDKTDYWLELADDDLKVARDMFRLKNYLWMGFVCHLIAEKAIKAVIANNTNEVPPKIHNLTRLAAIAGIFDELSAPQLELLKLLIPLQIEARYPEYKDNIREMLTPKLSESILKETEDFLCWIKQKLDKSQKSTPTE